MGALYRVLPRAIKTSIETPALPRPSPTAALALQLAASRQLRRRQVLPRRQRSCDLVRGRGPGAWWRPGRLAGLLLRLVIILHVLLFGSIALVLGLWKISNPAASSLMLYRRLTSHALIRPVRFIPWENIPASTRNAFIKLEDHDFWTHWGISPAAIKDAILINRQLGRTVYGASTITQQLARTLCLSPSRNLLRKYLEAGTAILMELILGKRRILELYLNYIEFGPGIFGLGSAARYHYGQPFSELDYDQRLRLAVIITSPLRYNVETLWKNRGMVARYRALTGEPPQ